MANFSFRELVEAFRKGIIAQEAFEKKLFAFMRDAYFEAERQNLKNGVGTGVTSLTPAMLKSMVERVCLSVFSNTDEFYHATDKYKEINEIDGISTDAYEIFHCCEQKIVLGTVKSEDARKNIKISFGMETGTVFVDIIGKKMDRYSEELMVSSYALADGSMVRVVDKKRHDSYVVNRNYVENAVICNRSDPSHMHVASTNGVNKKGEIHPNRFEEGGISDPVELALYEKYFRRDAKCPHYHFFQKSVCYNLNKNSASFAININDLSRYLGDLESVCSTGDKTSPLLKYDLGMPFLAMVKGDIACDMGDFIKTAKNVFQKYYGGERCKGITLLYDLIACTRRGDISGSLSCGSEIICFVDSNPAMQFENSNRYEYFMTPVIDKEKTLMLTTALAESFVGVGGEKLDANKLIKMQSKEEEKSNEPEKKSRFYMRRIENPIIEIDEDENGDEVIK